MKRKIIPMLLLPLLLSTAVLAESTSDKTARLGKNRKELELQMHRLRVEMINHDPELKQLVKKIMEMHKELQLRIDAAPAMKKLLQQATAIDLELQDMARQKKQSQ
ncbi:MAG: hypothetical protein PHQ27_05945 [Victivallales bacterium]|nr:hypothetical protein [Victivallales bacterium]